MPRTKRAPAEPKTSNQSKIRGLLLKKFDERLQEVMDTIDKKMEEELSQIVLQYASFRTKFTKKILSSTMMDIKNGDVEDTISVVLSDQTNTINSTRNITRASSATKTTNSTISLNGSSVNQTRVIKKNRAKRSVSEGYDEGYTTAESARDTTSGGKQNVTRQSRSKTRNIVNKSNVRSLSQNTTTKYKSGTKTPSNRQPLMLSGGTITPKCKLNTPLLYVRRPKIGEMAWSNQGSPLLLTGTIASEHTASVNIPLGGDILSMLPRRGVRESQIPDVDEQTRKQLEILRDNLVKLCASNKK